MTSSVFENFLYYYIFTNLVKKNHGKPKPAKAMSYDRVKSEFIVRLIIFFEKLHELGLISLQLHPLGVPKHENSSNHNNSCTHDPCHYISLSQLLSHYHLPLLNLNPSLLQKILHTHTHIIAFQFIYVYFFISFKCRK